MTRQRLDLREAAEVLGTSVDAVRKRISRGTLESEKADGKVYVWLDDGAPPSDSDALISAKDETIATLQEQLEAERQAHAEARRIIAGLVERVPAIEAPSDGRELQHRPEPPVAPGAQEGVPLPWWEETLKTTLPTVIAPLSTAVLAGLGSILAAAEGATILAAGGFVIGVISAVMAVYFFIRLQVERRRARLAVWASAQAQQTAAQMQQVAEELRTESDAQDETRERS